MIDRLDTRRLISALEGGAAYLELNRGILDRLNVFPVPDGDTGSNMCATLAAGIETIVGSREKIRTLSDLGIRFNTELSRSSRGNSGFILARFFHGFFEIAGSAETLDTRLLAAGMANGSYHVNAALFTPAEGTMVSILGAFSRALEDDDSRDLMSAFRKMITAGTTALERTPSQLPVLARAGVVDSGALGLLFIFRGIYQVLTGRPPVSENEGDYRFTPIPPDRSSPERAPDGDIAFRYCTEAVVSRNTAQDPELRSWLQSVGDSIAFVEDSRVIKIHIHTNDPEGVFRRLGKLGVLEQKKVDDMEEQSRLVSVGTGENGVAVLAFIPGEGFERFFDELGVSHCFVYGSRLPSPVEITDVLAGIEADNIIVLPNNGNILPSVLAARDLTTKNISIVPTQNVVQGLTVTYGFSEDETAAANVDAMNGFMDSAVGLFVYESSMDTRFGNVVLKKGDWFVIRDREVLGVDADPSRAVGTALAATETAGLTEALVFHGDGFDPRKLDDVVNVIRGVLAGVSATANVEAHYGGQNQAGLIISLE